MKIMAVMWKVCLEFAGLLASNFDPDISDKEEEVVGQENADGLGLERRVIALSHFCWV